MSKHFVVAIRAAKISPLDWAKGAMATHLLGAGSRSTFTPQLDAKNFREARRILRDASFKGDTEAAKLLKASDGLGRSHHEKTFRTRRRRL
jgi:hypothetical protein